MLTRFEALTGQEALALGGSTLPVPKDPVTLYGRGRVCKCGTILSIYNPQSACGPCTVRATVGY